MRTALLKILLCAIIKLPEPEFKLAFPGVTDYYCNKDDMCWHDDPKIKQLSTMIGQGSENENKDPSSK